MKVGLILECQADGPDEKVLRCFLRNFAPGIEVSTAPQSSKAGLLQSCGIAAQRLLDDGCDHVAIVWDQYPADWGDALAQRNRTPCLREDRRRIFEALQAANVDSTRVFLVGIEFMLESWLLADKSAIAAFLSRRLKRGITAQQVGSANPAKEKHPKDALSKMFERQSHQPYRDYVHAVLIAQEVQTLDELRRHCPTFQRFWQKATGGQ